MKIVIDWLLSLFKKEKEQISKTILPVIESKEDQFNFDFSKIKSRKWRGIVWHHSASPDSITRDWEGIVRYHKSYRVDFNIVTEREFERMRKEKQGKVFEEPWKDVGYNFGTEWENKKIICNIGRSLESIGAHAGVKGVSNLYNEQYIGICAIGNFDIVPPHPTHWEFNLDLTRALMKIFLIDKNEVIGHREVYDRLGVARQKSCPGGFWNMDKFRYEL